MASKPTSKTNATELTFAAAQKMTPDAIVALMTTRSEDGRRAYRDVCILFVALSEQLKSESDAVARLKKAKWSTSNIQNARTLYRAYERIVGGGLVTPDAFFLTVNYSMAVAVNSIFTHRNPTEALEIVKSRLGTSTGEDELLHIYETGKTYAEEKEKEKDEKAKKTAAPAETAKTEETAKPEAKAAATGTGASTSAAVPETESTEGEDETETVTKDKKDPMAEWEVQLKATEEIATHMVMNGVGNAADIRAKIAALLMNIDAAIEQANIKAA